MSKVYTDNVEKAQAIARGLEQKFDSVKKYGITQNQIARLKSVAAEVEAMSKELDEMREIVKQKASAASKRLAELTDEIRSAKQIIKPNFDQTHWIDYGIPDKR
mgnify:CR=1 FL=1